MLLQNIKFSVIDPDNERIAIYHESFNSAQELIDYCESLEESISIDALRWIDFYWHMGIFLN